MAPFTAFQILQGIETLPLRMARHVENTREIVAFLAAHPLVESVGYPELAGPSGSRARAKLLPKGCGAVFSFNLKGTRAQGRKFIEALKLFSHLANVGDAKSLVIHPASTTHFRMSAEELVERGHHRRARSGCRSASRTPDDLIEDLSRALYAAGKAKRRAMRAVVDGNDVYAYTGSRAVRSARCRPSCSSTAPATTTASGRCSRAISRTTASTSLAVDLPGHGRSGGDALPSVEAIADWIVALSSMRPVSRRRRSSGTRWDRLPRSSARRGIPTAWTKLALLGTGGADDGQRRAARRRTRNDHVAYELINGWSFSAGKQLGGNQVPGLWMTGNAMRLMERWQAGRALRRPRRVPRVRGGRRKRGAVRCPVLAILGARDLMAPREERRR